MKVLVLHIYFPGYIYLCRDFFTTNIYSFNQEIFPKRKIFPIMHGLENFDKIFLLHKLNFFILSSWKYPFPHHLLAGHYNNHQTEQGNLFKGKCIKFYISKINRWSLSKLHGWCGVVWSLVASLYIFVMSV